MNVHYFSNAIDIVLFLINILVRGILAYSDIMDISMA